MRSISLYRISILCCLALFALTTCGGDSSTNPTPSTPSPPPPPPAPVPTRIEIIPSSARLNAIGQTVQLAATVLDQNGSAVAGASVTWKSGTLDVATITDLGLVTAVGNGASVITAQSGSLSSTVNVTVSQTPGRIVIEPPLAELKTIGETVQLTATVQDRNQHPVSGAEVTWRSGDAEVASVSDQGLVTAVGNGTVRITARTGSVSASIDVKVMAPSLDRPALARIFEETDGPEWTDNTNWLTDAPVGEWYGITADSKGRVVTLNLFDNNLGGSIPMELGLLTYLEELNLGSNRISGEIPATIGQLENLGKLRLGNNRLSGGIPASIGQLTNLTELLITWNGLSGSIPAELGQLINLEWLALYRNQLSGEIPVELDGLTRLWRLEISDNRISGEIPATLSRLTNLEILDLANNRLAGAIPAALGRLTRLEVLALYQNQLTGALPAELGNLTILRELHLHENESLSGPLPDTFTNLELQFLNLGETDLCVPASSEFQTWIEGIDNVIATPCPDPEIETP
ncbi:MAG: hypothetical protein F4207_14955 [Gemmatimonadetes bacterium]|nr:hypothetical protein [Gemmatimonadota bacterium]MYG17701.1 hypothetical protein [Gemmatimonadota bacterium]